MYNVLEKLKSAEPLNDKEKIIHEQGLVSVLKSLHDEIDLAVLDAYGWSDLAGLMQVVNGNAQSGGQDREAERKPECGPDAGGVHFGPKPFGTSLGALQKKGAEGQKDQERLESDRDPGADPQAGDRGAVDEGSAHRSSLGKWVGGEADPRVSGTGYCGA